MPGVSMSTPPPASSMSWRAVVVCRPRSSPRSAPTACASRPSKRFVSDDLPTPDEPMKPDGFAAARCAHEAPRCPPPDAALARTTGTPIAARLDGFEHRREVRVEIDFVEHDDGLGAAVPHGRDVTLEAPLVELAIDGRDDEEHVDVDADDLRLRERAGGAAQQRGAPLEHVLDRRAIGAVDDGHPVADDGALDLASATRATCR